MSMVRVKICGINDPVAFDTAVAAGADYVGLNFFPPSPRFVTPAQAAALSARHSGGPLRVGLFVDPADEAIAAVLDAMRLDVLQLYGRVDFPGVRARFGLPVWRAVGIDTAADLPCDAGGADALVLEAKPPPEATRPGGNATRFDWSLLRDWTAPAPWILAGGLTPDNVAEAIHATGAATVDVSSGVERARGVKDPALIRRFVTLCRGAVPARAGGVEAPQCRG
jgi:phosphoribosylanthranilate isomerase